MNAKKRETDTPAQPTNEETAAHWRITLSTAGEDRWKCGLEFICNLLDNARGFAEAEAEKILPNVADVKLNPARSLASLSTTPPGCIPAVNLSELCELIFVQLQKEAVLKPDVELLHRKCWRGRTRLEEFAYYWFVFLFGWNGNGGCLAFMRKKIALAQALGTNRAADKLDEAFRQLMPSFTFTDWDADAKRFAAEITPDDFYVAFRNALKLDDEATAEINGEGKSTGVETDELKAELEKDLAPDKSKTDAIKYCARLVCHVWNNIDEHGSKRKSTDYVFALAQNGNRLFGVCKRARELAARWAISTGTVQTEAATLHARQSGTKHKKRDGMERPETMRQAANKSRAKEQAEERAERKQKADHGARQSGKKR